MITRVRDEAGRSPADADEPGFISEGRRLAEFIAEDEKSMAGRDKRFEYSEVSHQSRGFVDAWLPVVRVKNARSLSPSHKKNLGIAAECSAPMLILGAGLAQGRTSAFYEHWALEDFQRLVAEQVRRSSEDGAICVAPFVPRRMLPGFRTSDSGDIAAEHCDDWWTLHLEAGDDSAGVDPQAWIQAQPRRVRQTWNRDYRIAHDRGATFSPVVATVEALEPLIPMFQETMSHNGDCLDVNTVRWYLSRRFELSGCHYLCVTEEHGKPVGALLLRVKDSYCDAYAVGTSPDVSQWRDLYQLAVFVASMEFARHHHLSAIGFGRSHGRPKMIRGCRPDPLYRVSYRKGS
jgi:hypothetical protein